MHADTSPLTLAEIDGFITGASSGSDGFQLIAKDKVMVRSYPAYRFVFDYQSNATTTERRANVYFATGEYVVQVDCNTAPEDYAAVAAIFDGIAGSFILAP